MEIAPAVRFAFRFSSNEPMARVQGTNVRGETSMCVRWRASAPRDGDVAGSDADHGVYPSLNQAARHSISTMVAVWHTVNLFTNHRGGALDNYSE